MKRITYLFILLAVSLGYSQTELLLNGDFETGDGTNWTGNSVNVVDDGSTSNWVNEANVLAAGNPWDANISQAVTLVNGTTYTFSFVAYTSTGATRSMVAGIGEAADDFENAFENPPLTDVPTVFTYQMTPNWNDAANGRVFFDMGAETGFVFIDNVSLVVTPPTELLINGDFETGDGTNWTGNSVNVVDDGSTSNWVNEANVLAAGNPWDANISQAVTLVNGTTYTFSFVAYTSTGATRSMVAGIGEAGDDFENAFENPPLTDVPTVFTYQMTPNWNDAANGRVFFDMGAETGFVFIDNVSLTGAAVGPPAETCSDGIQNQDETGVDCGGVCAPCAVFVLPTTAPPTPPARAAADVISIYGTAYGTAVGLNNVDWDEGTESVEETIAGNEVLKIDFVNFLGTDLGAVTDATDMTHFHMDFWVADSWAAGQVFNSKWSNHNPVKGAGETDAFELPFALGPLDVQTWVSFDVPLSSALNAKGDGVNDREFLTQLLLTVSGTLDLGYVDNIYFHKNTTLSADKFDALVFSAYPNPSNGKWQVKTKSENIKTVKVYDLQGKQVLGLKPNADNFTIDGSQLSPGLYLAKIESQSKTQTLKLVKK